MNCCDRPRVRVGFEGVTVINAGVAGVTVNMVEPLIEPRVAVIDVLPAVSDAASPAVGAVVLIVATAGFDDDHVTCPVRPWVLPSL